MVVNRGDEAIRGKVLLVAWFDGLARILSKVAEIGVCPDGLLDAKIAMTPKADGDAIHLVSVR